MLPPSVGRISFFQTLQIFFQAFSSHFPNLQSLAEPSVVPLPGLSKIGFVCLVSVSQLVESSVLHLSEYAGLPTIVLVGKLRLVSVSQHSSVHLPNGAEL